MHIAFDDTVCEAPRYTKCGFAPDEFKKFFEQSESLTQPGKASESSHAMRNHAPVGILNSDEALWTTLEEFERPVVHLHELSSSSMDTRRGFLNSGPCAGFSDRLPQADEASPAASIPSILRKKLSARISTDTSPRHDPRINASSSTKISMQSFYDRGSLPHEFEECSPSSISSQLQKSFAAFRRELSRDFQDWKRDLCLDFHRIMQGVHVPDEISSLDKGQHSGVSKSSLSSIAENHVPSSRPSSLPSMCGLDSTGTAMQSSGTIHSTGTRDAMPILSDSSSLRGFPSGLPPTHPMRRNTVATASVRLSSLATRTTFGTTNGSIISRRLSSLVDAMSRISQQTDTHGTLFGHVDVILAEQALKDYDPYNVESLYHTNGLAQCVATSRIFNLSVLLMICFNTFFMAIEADYNRDDRLADSHWAFQLCENAFSMFFALEISIRFCAFARKRDSLGDSWFVVDSLLALHMLVDTYVLDLLSPKSLRRRRFFRLLRLLRFARLLRASSSMRTIMKAISAGARAIASTGVMVIFLTYLFALAFKFLLVDENSMKKYFGDIPASMCTLLVQGIFMDGISDVFEKLRKIPAPVSIVFLFAYVLLSNFVMINVFLGIICKVVNKVAKAEEESRAWIHVARATLALLQSLDIDSNRCISKGEFLELFKNPQAVATLEELRIDADYVHGMTEILFTTADAELPISVVVDLLLKHRIERPCHTGEMMRAMKLQRFWAARQYEKLADEVTRSIREFARSSNHL